MPPDPKAGDEPRPELTAVYERLRRLAALALARERPDHTLQPTALVHETWLRLQSWRADHELEEREWLHLAASVMRRVLTDHARARGAAKRDGGRRQLLADLPAPDAAALVLEVDEALQSLSLLDAELAALVELRFFGGHTLVEIAALTGQSLRSVNRRWQLARSWLADVLRDGGAEAHGR